jgi:hypothetical protein
VLHAASRNNSPIMAGTISWVCSASSAAKCGTRKLGRTQLRRACTGTEPAMDRMESNMYYFLQVLARCRRERERHERDTGMHEREERYSSR